jgi:preprotein translocase subunit SecA
MNKQRQVIYGERNRILDGKDINSRVTEMMGETITELVKTHCPEKAYSEEWDWDGLAEDLKALAGTDLVTPAMRSAENPYELADELTEAALAFYAAKEAELGAENLRQLERQVMLRVIDTRWMNHLLEMDYLREGIGLRAMGQRDPLVEYKAEAYEMFGFLVGEINHDFLRTIMHIQVVRETPAPEVLTKQVSYSAPSEQSIFSGAMQQAAASVDGPSEDAISRAASVAGKGGGHTVEKDKEDPYANVGRNDPCPCGSGRKFKHCHGASA